MSANNDIDLKDSDLYGVNNIKQVLHMLNIKDETELDSLLSDDNYKIYPTGPKKRIVEEPNKPLKKVQAKFNKILQKIKTPEYVYAGRKKMDYISNAKAHLSCNDMLCTDIRKFFPHTNIKYLLNFLINDLNISSNIAEYMATLLTVKGHLPTGAPSSLLLTFWMYKNSFDKIYEFAKNLGVTMTVYVDDMTFSSKSKVSIKLLPYVMQELSSVGLQLHQDKIKHFKCSEYKHVTGVCIDKKHKLVVPNKQRKKLIDILESREQLDELTTEELESCMGMIIAMQRIEPKIFTPTLKKLNKIYKMRPKRIVTNK